MGQIQSPPYPPGASKLLQTTCPSSKFVPFVRDMYLLLLGRGADDGGLHSYANHLEGGRLSPKKFKEELLTSGEGKDRTKELADAFLSKWGRDLEGDVTNPDRVRESFGQVRAAYLSFLGREPDDGGLKGNMSQLLKGDMTLQQLERALAW